MKVKIAVCQLKVGKRKDENLSRARSMIEDASLQKPDIIILPEMFNCPYDPAYFEKFAETYPGETTMMMSNLSKKLGIYLIGGSITEKEGDLIYNTSFVFDPEGALTAKHRKIHLFDVNIRDGITFRESDYISPGSNITVFDAGPLRVGLAVCFDMRFPELIRKMTLMGAKTIIVPAAFNMITGPAHWHIISRTRALDNQVYFIAASPARDNYSGYVVYGHSLVIDPWGKILNELDEKEGIIIEDLDFDYMDKIRDELPLLKQRRPELY